MIAANPSRDNQDDLHWLKDLHALSGWPKCNVEDNKPKVIKIKLIIIRDNFKLNSKFISEINAKYDKQIIIPYPVPDNTVKNIIDLLGCIFNNFLPAIKR